MIEMSEFQQRRSELMSQLPKDSLAILAAAPERPRTGDTYYRYRQDSHFYYLTGFHEPEAMAILIPGRTDGEYVLFNRAKDRQQEIWHGLITGQDAACRDYLADEAYPVTEFAAKLAELAKGKSKVFFSFSGEYSLERQVMTCLRQLSAQQRSGVTAANTLINLDAIIAEMRLIKSEQEIALMRHVSEISARAHLRLMKNCRHYEYEYQLEADLLHEFMSHGCRSQAYDSIVGSGKNACILHYTDNNQALGSDELVLIDAGGEYQNYAADITRTFPVKGRFTEDQKALYCIVLEAQQAGIATVKPGVAWNRIQEVMVRIITQGLLDLGLLQGELDELITSAAYKKFYMHNSGHWLGLDVHDVGAYKVDGEWRPLQAGMVLTVEPGIYIDASHQDIDPRWHNIGIRIEDDVLVTDDGCEVLTASVPKTIEEIETVMAG